MLSRRKLFGFLAAAPVIGPALAKAAEPKRLVTITVNHPVQSTLKMSSLDGRFRIAYGRIIIND